MTTVLDKTSGAEAASAEQRTGRAHLRRAKPISVNGVVIANGDIARETQHHPAAKPIDAWLAAARALVVRELLLQEAHRLALAPAPLSDAEGRRETDDEALIRQLVEREVVTPEPDEATCRRIYDLRRQTFRSSDLFAVRHILIAAHPSDVPARAEASRQAEALIDLLSTGGAGFAELALAYSACPSKQHGGALGQISRGQTVPEFEATLAQAPVGAVAPRPVETRYGLHVVLVDQRLEGEQLPFEIVHERIAAWLADGSRATALRQYISLLAGRAEIVGIELPASAPNVGY